jgi:phenylacetic acid degradation operon negative regulatory protein
MEIVDSILAVLDAWGGLIPRPFETKGAMARRLRGMSRRQFDHGIVHLRQRGMVTIISKKDKKFIKITRAGQLELLLKKAKKALKQQWDGKWRVIIFDIPENSKDKRHLFRALLKANGFYKLQDSVYINPYSLNLEAIRYLKETGLIDYIRILRVDKLDSDSFLKRHFGLI